MSRWGEGTLCLPVLLPALPIVPIPSLATSFFSSISSPPPPLPHRSGSVDVGYRSSDFLSLCWIVLLCLWSEKKHMTHKVSQTNSGLLLRKWWWIRREGVFLGLLQETHTYPRTQHTLMHTYSWVTKKTQSLRINGILSLALEQL